MKRPLAIIVLVVLLASTVVWWQSSQGAPRVSGASSTKYASSIATALPSATPMVMYKRPELQTGIIFPQWGTDAYSANDPYWSVGLKEIEAQTGARWIEISINFFQDNFDSTTVGPSATMVSPDSVRQGIQFAHAMGKHVFLVPIISLRNNTSDTHDKWSGDIRCVTMETCTSWFKNYFAAYKPYLQVAQDTGVEQVAIGTEFSNLEILREHYWDDLIRNISSVYHGKLTYDLNFTTLIAHANDLPSFFRNSTLYALGVSAYFSLQGAPAPINPDQVAPLWANKVRAPLDALSKATGKPVLISEIGYRNSTDALYLPFSSTPTPDSKPDPALQAEAYDATMKNVVEDTMIVGVYFWAWSAGPPFAPNNLPAASVLHKWYTSPEA